MRLRRSDSSSAGYTRVRAGSGFSYRDKRGATVSDAELRARFDALAIPPAWTDVWIAPFENGHVQATGIDGVGRRQYIYHPTWREQKDRIKFDRSLRLAESLPAARRLVTLDLRGSGPSKERALAAAFRMLDSGSLRIGSERYAAEHGSRGIATLLCSHASVGGDRIRLEFPAKSKRAWSSELVDADLARVVRSLKRREPNARLLAWRSGREWHPLQPSEINEYVKLRAGDDFTAKDFRTLHGTVSAAVSLAQHGPAQTQRERSSAVAQAMRDAARTLSNTPAIARSSYVDPRLLDHYRAGETIDSARLGSAESELRALLYR